MKVFLMHVDRDFELGRELPANETALTHDLELNTVLTAMAAGDRFLFSAKMIRRWRAESSTRSWPA